MILVEILFHYRPDVSICPDRRKVIDESHESRPTAPTDLLNDKSIQKARRPVYLQLTRQFFSICHEQRPLLSLLLLLLLKMMMKMLALYKK